MRASEDFGRFGQRAPAAMFFLGAGENHPGLHNPDYDFPDGLIEIGARVPHADTSRFARIDGAVVATDAAALETARQRCAPKRRPEIAQPATIAIPAFWRRHGTPVSQKCLTGCSDIHTIRTRERIEPMRIFDLISMGRTIVDVYGNQVGCGLEETSSFSRYVGGCPANVAIGTARLGLRVAHVTRVGDDHHGRFLRDQLFREEIDFSHIKTDPGASYGRGIFGYTRPGYVSLLHYRDDCADMAISAEDYSRGSSSAARLPFLSLAPISRPRKPRQMSTPRSRTPRQADTRVIFDIDYRPVFWRLVAKDAGESRYVSSGLATSATQHVLPQRRPDRGDGRRNPYRRRGHRHPGRLSRIRRLSAAPIVMKRGPQGCLVFDGAIPGDPGPGDSRTGFLVEIFNIVGAGDGFLSGFLSGWLRGASWQECCRRGNACGALVCRGTAARRLRRPTRNWSGIWRTPRIKLHCTITHP